MPHKLRIETTKLDGVKLIHPHAAHEDFRGDYVETYNEDVYKAAGIADRFVEDDVATSSKHVLRGVHGDDRTVKLISCLYGTLYVMNVNNDPNHKQYRQWQAFTLSAHNRLRLYVPPKFGTGYLVMSDVGIFHYKQSCYYEGAENQFTIKWNDPAYNMWWPVKDPILSQRDFG
jgi:dTDP-4-dehydrorhamnose 3,5-epimerase